MSTITKLKPEIRFEPATGTVGAFVHGVPLAVVGADMASELQRALHEYGVLFFQFDHVVSSEELEAFAEQFGEIEGSRLSTGKNTQGFLDSEVVPMKEYRVNYWHADGTPFERPPQAAIMTPYELPEAGGDTMWASMYAAWDDLSSHYQRLLEGLEVVHSTARTPYLKPAASFTHPAVITDKVTGRKILYVNSNYAERFVGMRDSESEALLQMLFRHINTPEFHVRLRWRLGTVAIWEERVTQHRGVADFTGPRKLRRLTFVGDRPSA